MRWSPASAQSRSPTNYISSKLHSSQAAILAHFLVALDNLERCDRELLYCMLLPNTRRYSHGIELQSDLQSTVDPMGDTTRCESDRYAAVGGIKLGQPTALLLLLDDDEPIGVVYLGLLWPSGQEDRSKSGQRRTASVSGHGVVIVGGK